MNRTLLGAFAAMVLLALGLFYWQGRAVQDVGQAPPSPDLADSDGGPEALPSADVGDIQGPTLPEAAGMSDEQRRFARYDRNRDLIISRNEMLSTRTSAFRKLDRDGNNLLTFEEWAVATVDRFEGADSNDDDRLTPAEFATTRRVPTPRATSTCAC